MSNIKTIKLRIKDSGCKKFWVEQAKAVNRVWNYCNEISIKAWKEHRSKKPTSFDLINLVSGASKELGTSSVVVQQTCRKFAQARDKKISSFFQGKKSKGCFFKMRWRSKNSLGWLPLLPGCLKLSKDGFVYLKRNFRVFQPERLPDFKLVKSAQIVQDSLGNWYICIQAEFPVMPPISTKSVGIDLGLKNVVSFSDDSEPVKAPQFFRKSQAKLAIAQRKAKRTITGKIRESFSKKQSRKAKKIHAKIKQQRMDFCHKLTTKIVKEYSTIVVGKLEAAKLAKTRMAKSILDASTALIRSMLAYKARMQQHRYVEVNEAFTTRTCSDCGAIPKEAPKGRAGLSIREWTCGECGAVHDRDQNAARNILRIGLDSLLKAGISAL